MVSKESLKKQKIGILAGPTATGKSSVALEFAQKFKNIEIINADSLLVYRTMDIGTAKPTLHEQKEIPHHLIDIRNPDEPFTAGEFFRAAQNAIELILERGNRPLIVGGTGFYLKSLLFGLWEAPAADLDLRKRLDQKDNLELHQQLQGVDPVSAARIGPTDRYRLIRALELIELTGSSPSELQAKISAQPNPQFQLWILDRPSEELERRIQQRTQQMLADGMVDEYQKIQNEFPDCRPLKAVGYAQVSAYLENRTPAGRKIKPGLAGLQEEIQLATRQLVKSQRTWFRGQCKNVPNSNWYLLDFEKTKLTADFTSVYGEL